MKLAQELRMPVIIHDREAHADCLEIVREFPDVTGVFHCYSGSAETAKELIDRGYYLSFTGVITFKNEKKSATVIPSVPLERIMIETDSPYLSPVPYRGKRNSSRYVHRVAETIAALRGMSVTEIESITTQNAKRFFGIADGTE